MCEMKFRGFCHEFGGFVYGRLIERDDYNSGHFNYYIEGIDEDYGDYLPEVDIDTVARMVGRDKNGIEIYEGDRLVDKVGGKHIATIYDSPEFIAELTFYGGDKDVTDKRGDKANTGCDT